MPSRDESDDDEPAPIVVAPVAASVAAPVAAPQPNLGRMLSVKTTRTVMGVENLC